MIHETEHTVTVEIDCVNNVNSIDQNTRARRVLEVDQQFEECTIDDSQSKQQNDQPTSGDGPNPQWGRQENGALGAEAENVAPRISSEDMRHQEAGALADEDGKNDQSTHDDTKRQVESTEYVVDRLIAH